MEKRADAKRLRAAAFRCFGALMVLLLAVGFLSYRGKQKEKAQTHTVEVVKPTCTENGYTLYTDKQTGEVSTGHVVAALGHDFRKWKQISPMEGVNCAVYSGTCHACGVVEQRVEYPKLGIARISLTGSLDGIGKKTEVPMTVHFEDTEQGVSFDSYATLKYQGHSSLIYDKKNYNLKLYQDAEHKEKNKIALSHWNKEHKYILKANYIDPSQCRNLVCADVWAEICASRETLAPQLKELSNYGAVDGFPVAVYINDEFHGLFTMNLHKDENLFAMEEGEHHTMVNCNDEGTAEAEFRAPAQFTEESLWEMEYCGTEDQQWAEDKLNGLIDFVRTADDARFKAELHRYLDVNSAVDYLIAIYALGLTDNAIGDLLLVSYGEEWIASLYDMESAFGLNKEGSDTFDVHEFLPSRGEGGWDSGTDSLLWDRLLNNFEDQICRRYAQLREKILAPEYLCGQVTAFIGSIPELLYTADARQNPGMPDEVEHETQITTYIEQRIPLLDALFTQKEG